MCALARCLALVSLVACSLAPGDPPAAPPAEDSPDLAMVDGASMGATVVRVHYPAGPNGARRLFLRGDKPPFSWTRGVPMQPLSESVYELRIDAGALEGALEFKPLLDDSVWSRGGNFRIDAGRVGRAGQELDIYPYFFSERGSFSRRYAALHSAILNNDRGVWVYLPPGYEENPLRRYPVLYMHDGQNLFDPRAAFGGVTWRVAETLDEGAGALDSALHIPEVIVVGPENAGAARLYEYTPTEGGEGGGGGDLYLRFLIEELKPQIDRELRTRPKDTALCGSSLGGLISAYAGLTQAQVFGRVAALSPSTWWDGTYLIGAVEKSTGKMPRPARVYLDSGDSGPSRDDVDNTRRLAQAYRDVGYRDGSDLLHVVQKGAQHSEAYWAQRLPAALRFLLAGY